MHMAPTIASDTLFTPSVCSLGLEPPVENKDIPLQEYYSEISDEPKTVPNAVCGLIPTNNSGNGYDTAMKCKCETSTVCCYSNTSRIVMFACIYLSICMSKDHYPCNHALYCARTLLTKSAFSFRKILMRDIVYLHYHLQFAG